MQEKDQGADGAQDRVVGVNENGLLVGALQMPGEPVTITVSHRHIAYWEVGGGLGICNTCGTLQPEQVFGATHPEGNCPTCGASMHEVDRPAGAARRERNPLSRGDLQAILDGERRKAARAQRLEAERAARLSNVASEELLAALRQASRTDYEQWLEGYLQRGGRPSHACDYPFPSRRWYVAVADFTAEPLHGAAALNIIVPAGIRYSVPNGLGHCHLYEMETHTCHDGWVPLFRDMRFV